MVDANGTRFHLLLGQADWAACTVEELGTTLGQLWASVPPGELLSRQGWDATHAELTLPAEVFRFPSSPGLVPPPLGARRGAASDAYGNWYWIDDAQTGILVRSSGSGQVTTFWSTAQATQTPPASAGQFRPQAPPPAAPSSLRGLTVTPDHYLIVGVLEPAGLLIFDLHAGGPPRQEAWPAGFRPFDMAAGAAGTWILDRDLGAGAPGARLWLLDRHLGVVALQVPSPLAPPAAPSVFHALDGTPSLAGYACDVAPTLGLDLAVALTSVGDAVACEVLPDGSCLLLDNGGDGHLPAFSQLWRFSHDAGLSGPFSLRDLASLVDADQRASFSLLGHDLAYVAPSTLVVVAQDSRQAFAFDVLPEYGASLRFDALPGYWPMRLSGGRGLLTSGGRAYYDARNVWVPLVQQPRARYETQRTLLTPVETDPVRRDVPHAFDGREPGCVWHRLLLDGCLPPETALHVWSRAADSEADLVTTAWQAEPDPYRRSSGSELPFITSNDVDTWELLFQRARGRFLQLRLQLVGNTRGSPRLRALRAYYPRFSYLDHYLPAAYREDAQSASFLDRFLANLEGIYTTLEDRLEAIAALFDPRTAPAADLAWLAGWLGIVLDPNWDEARQRLLIARAPDLFRLRGTRLGLIRAIRLATDPCPTPAIFDDDQDDEAALQPGHRPVRVRVVEQFRTRRAPGVVFGDPTALVGPGVTTPTERWQPAQGAAALHARFQAFLQQQYGDLASLNAAWGTSLADLGSITLAATRPADPTQARDWAAFLAAGLGFTYAPVETTDAPAFRDFLSRRYGSVQALNVAYGLRGAATYSSLDGVGLPQALPSQPAALRDWVQFVSIVLPTLRSAHRFSVLIPTVTDPATDDRGALIERVRRIVELEKPAHTVFDVKEYWALFRVGEARLGLDTLLDRGSRLVPVVLDATYLAGGYMSFPHPFNLARRMVLGQDRLADRRPL